MSVTPADAGPVSVLPLLCTTFPTADDTALHSGQKSAAVFNYSPEDEELTQNRSIQSTETSQQLRKLITSFLYSDLGKGSFM